MATLGKLTIIIGAGIVGSILTKDGGSSTVRDFFSGTLKFVTKQLQQDKDNSRSTSKPHSDSLLAQVNNLRQELQLLASSRSVTIVTGSTSGSGTYSVTAVIVVGFVGYGYIWWKGWKLSEIMFVTRRGLSDACATVGKQLEIVSSSITSAKRHLSSRIDRVDSNLDECKELTAATKEEVSKLHGELSGFHMDFESVHRTVQSLETKLDRIEEGQNFATEGVYHLCQLAHRVEHRRNNEVLQASLSSSSQQALELPQTMPVTRMGALPPLTLDPPSPSTSVRTPKILRPPTSVSPSGLKASPSSSSPQALELPQTLPVTRTDSLPPLAMEPPSPSASVRAPKILRPPNSVSPSGRKELQEFSSGLKAGISRSSSIESGASAVSTGIPSKEEPSSSTSSSSRFGWKLPGFGLLTRSHSTTS